MYASLASIFLATTFAVNTMPEAAHDDRRLCNCVIVELCKCGNAELMQSGGCYDKRGTSVPIPLCLIPLFHNSIIPQSRGGIVLQPAWPSLASWMLNFSPAGVPKSLATSVSGTGVFAALAEHPPQFLFSKDWNMARVTCRGLDVPNPRIECSVKNIPLVIRIR